jgi:hypothetical protein
LARFEAALLALDPVTRDDPRHLRFGLSHLQTKGHELTITTAGALDVLGSVNEEELSFEDLLPHTDRMDFDGLEVRVLQLAKLVELKRQLGRPKDLAVLPLLEARQSRGL